MIAIDIVVLDYGLGNGNSVVSFLKSLGCHAIASSDPKQIASAKALFIPGVGAFNSGMVKLEAQKLIPVLQDFRDSGALVVGICLGMQMFAQRSHENGDTKGLAWIPGEVCHLQALDVEVNQGEWRIPHIGWNRVLWTSGCVWRTKLDDDQFYFDHSYYFRCDAAYVLAQVSGSRASKLGCFPCVVRKDNVVGFQFHPEKSQLAGKKLIVQLLDEYQIERKPLCLNHP